MLKWLSFLRNITVVFFLFGITFSLFSQDDTYDILKSQYNRLSQEQKLDSAIIFARQMNSWTFENEGDTSIRFAVSCRYIGNCFTLADSALYYYDLSLLILKKQKREIHADYSKTLNNIGNIYKNSGDFVKAEKYYKEAIIIFEKLIEKKCFDRFYLISSLNLSRLYYFENQQFDKVEEPLLNAINNSDQFVDNMNLDLGDCYDFLANYYRRTSQFDKAIYYFDKVIEIVDYHKLNNTSAYAVTLDNLGILYQELNDNNRAEQFFIKALEINTKVFGENDESVAQNLENLGSIKTAEGKYNEAKMYLEKSNKIIKNIYGSNHPEYATSLVCIGILYSSMGDLNKGLSYFNDALKIACRKHDLVAIRLFDEREKELPNVGLLKIQDSETGKSIWVDSGSADRALPQDQCIRNKLHLFFEPMPLEHQVTQDKPTWLLPAIYIHA